MKKDDSYVPREIYRGDIVQRFMDQLELSPEKKDPDVRELHSELARRSKNDKRAQSACRQQLFKRRIRLASLLASPVCLLILYYDSFAYAAPTNFWLNASLVLLFTCALGLELRDRRIRKLAIQQFKKEIKQ